MPSRFLLSLKLVFALFTANENQPPEWTAGFRVNQLWGDVPIYIKTPFIGG
jgi:hypothetical protein